jgi:hypothetical protein
MLHKKDIYNLKSKKILAIVFFVLSFAVITGVVSAQTVIPLTVGPVRQQLNVNPGERAQVVVRFFNLSDVPISGVVKAADFVVEDSNGTPRIVENIDQANPRFAASNWIDMPYDRITINANDKVTIPVTINVPAEAKAGGRYVSVYFEPSVSVPQSVNSSQEAGASITPRIASLLYMRVAGDIKENALISRFFAPSFFEYGPINVDTQILNKGDYHVRPRGVITISNMFGGLVDQSSLKEQNIFPDALRNYTNSLGQKWMFGKYKVEIAASYGEQGRALSRFIEVWVFPWKIITVILLALVIVVLFLRHIYKSVVVKETDLETQVMRDRDEIEKLKEELRKKDH